MAEQLEAVPVIEFIVFRRLERHWMERHRRPRALYKYCDTVDVCTSLRPCTTVLAVFAGQWMVPLFSSSTEWRILPLCYRDRYAQCQIVYFGLD